MKQRWRDRPASDAENVPPGVESPGLRSRVAPAPQYTSYNSHRFADYTGNSADEAHCERGVGDRAFDSSVRQYSRDFARPSRWRGRRRQRRQPSASPEPRAFYDSASNSEIPADRPRRRFAAAGGAASDADGGRTQSALHRAYGGLLPAVPGHTLASGFPKAPSRSTRETQLSNLLCDVDAGTGCDDAYFDTGGSMENMRYAATGTWSRNPKRLPTGWTASGVAPKIATSIDCCSTTSCRRRHHHRDCCHGTADGCCSSSGTASSQRRSAVLAVLDRCAAACTEQAALVRQLRDITATESGGGRHTAEVAARFVDLVQQLQQTGTVFRSNVEQLWATAAAAAAVPTPTLSSSPHHGRWGSGSGRVACIRRESAARGPTWSATSPVVPRGNTRPSLTAAPPAVACGCRGDQSRSHCNACSGRPASSSSSLCASCNPPNGPGSPSPARTRHEEKRTDISPEPDASHPAFSWSQDTSKPPPPPRRRVCRPPQAQIGTVPDSTCGEQAHSHRRESRLHQQPLPRQPLYDDEGGNHCQSCCRDRPAHVPTGTRRAPSLDKKRTSAACAPGAASIIQTAAAAALQALSTALNSYDVAPEDTAAAAGAPRQTEPRGSGTPGANSNLQQALKTAFQVPDEQCASAAGLLRALSRGAQPPPPPAAALADAEEGYDGGAEWSSPGGGDADPPPGQIDDAEARHRPDNARAPSSDCSSDCSRDCSSDRSAPSSVRSARAGVGRASPRTAEAPASPAAAYQRAMEGPRSPYPASTSSSGSSRALGRRARLAVPGCGWGGAARSPPPPAPAPPPAAAAGFAQSETTAETPGGFPRAFAGGGRALAARKAAPPPAAPPRPPNRPVVPPLGLREKRVGSGAWLSGAATQGDTYAA